MVNNSTNINKHDELSLPILTEFIETKKDYHRYMTLEIQDI